MKPNGEKGGINRMNRLKGKKKKENRSLKDRFSEKNRECCASSGRVYRFEGTGQMKMPDFNRGKKALGQWLR